MKLQILFVIFKINRQLNGHYLILKLEKPKNYISKKKKSII